MLLHDQNRLASMTHCSHARHHCARLRTLSSHQCGSSPRAVRPRTAGRHLPPESLLPSGLSISRNRPSCRRRSWASRDRKLSNMAESSITRSLTFCSTSSWSSCSRIRRFHRCYQRSSIGRHEILQALLLKTSYQPHLSLDDITLRVTLFICERKEVTYSICPSFTFSISSLMNRRSCSIAFHSRCKFCGKLKRSKDIPGLIHHCGHHFETMDLICSAFSSTVDMELPPIAIPV